MQLDGDTERNHSFLSPRWGRLASTRACLALWPFLSLLFSIHILLFCALYFPCHALLFNMHDHFIPVFMRLLHGTCTFQGLAHFSQGDSGNEMAQEEFIYLLHSSAEKSPTLILSPNPYIIGNWIVLLLFLLCEQQDQLAWWNICCFIIHSVKFDVDLGNTCVLATLLFFLRYALTPNAHCTETEVWPWPWKREHIHTNLI